MKAVFQIAWREIKQYMSTRGFWIGILMVPLIFGFIRFLPLLKDTALPVRNFVMVDAEGGYREALLLAMERSHQYRVLQAAGAYAQAFARPGEAERAENRFEDVLDGFTRLDIEERIKAVEELLVSLSPLIREDAPPFTAPRREYNMVALPADIPSTSSLDELARSLAPYLLSERLIDVDGRQERLFAAVIVPPYEIDPEAEDNWPVVQYWSDNLSDTRLRDFVERALSREVRRRAYAEQGLDPVAIAEAQRAHADLRSFRPRLKAPDKPSETTVASPTDETAEPQAREVDETDAVETYLPMGLAYVLFVSIFTMAGILLTNVIEEKSNRIVELLLSSVTPLQLMLGKLLGVATIGLTMVTAWTIGGFLAFGIGGGGEAPAMSGDLAGVLISSNLLFAFLAYFIPGYLMYASIFLGVGSMCSTVSDAQAYLGPLMTIMFVPLLLLGLILLDPNGVLARTISWIPLYTPYFMMLRLGSHPPMFDVIGTYVMMVVTVAVMIWLMARVFRQSILRTGQPPKLVEVFRMLRNRTAGA